MPYEDTETFVCSIPAFIGVAALSETKQPTLHPQLLVLPSRIVSCTMDGSFDHLIPLASSRSHPSLKALCNKYGAQKLPPTTSR